MPWGFKWVWIIFHISVLLKLYHSEALWGGILNVPFEAPRWASAFANLVSRVKYWLIDKSERES